MSLQQIMIAIAVTAAAIAVVAARLTIRRLRTDLANAAWRLAHDPLTGLPNRTGLLATHATLAAAGASQPVIVALADLDEFKHVNDAHGHRTGDDLLIVVADRVSQTAALYGGVAARLSGDEFAVRLPVRGQTSARVADTFLTMIGQPVELTVDDQPVTITPAASLGVTTIESTDPLEDGLHRADIAMYHAKRRGGDTVTSYEPGMAMPDLQFRRGPRLRDLRHRGGTA